MSSLNDVCAVENALNKYLNKEEKRVESFENLLDELDDDFVELDTMIKKIKMIARNYENYDFSEDIEDVIKDFI